MGAHAQQAEARANYRRQLQHLVLDEDMQPDERAALAAYCIDDMEQRYGNPQPAWLADLHSAFCASYAGMRALHRILWERRIKSVYLRAYREARAARRQNPRFN